MDTITVTVNGAEVQARPGMTILELAREKGLDEIPTLCHLDGLEPYGSCFLCVVEVKGRPSLVPSCATRLAPGMEIQTRSERVAESRRTALELLLSNHYADCVAPCALACPAGVDTQGYVALSAMGRHRDAIDLIREVNPFPAVCGRICVRKCEAECRRAELEGSVGINAVKRFLSDAPGAYEGEVAVVPPTGKSVGIVGAGPAGLTAAWFLGLKGHRTVVYESMPRPGGMLRYGIPVYRLPDEALDRDIDYLRKAGVEIKTGVKIGRDFSLGELRKTHDALFVAAGGWSANPMGVDGELDTEGVVNGIDFLREKSMRPEPVRGTVVVVGGGNTAIDVARTARRLGADKVILMYRRTRAEMPADQMEIEEGIEEGVELLELAAPVGIVAREGRLAALRCVRMRLGEPDKSGRRRPVPLEGSEMELPCRWAVAAIGQSPMLDGLLAVGDQALATTGRGTIAVEPLTLSTSVPGVFAGGDAADDGPTVVVDAIADGRKAALAIHEFLTGERPEPKPFLVSRELWGKPGKAELGDVAESVRREIPKLDIGKRSSCFDEVALGLDPEDLALEMARCLSCGCVRLEDCSLRRYAQEYGVDMERYKGQVRRHKIDDRHPHIVYDPNKCILCALCVRTCGRMLPLSALGLVGRGFRTEMRPAMNDALSETGCVSCGNCIDACPTGALTEKYAYPGRAALEADQAETHCAFCSLLCPIVVKSHGGSRYSLAPSGRPRTYLCRHGRFGAELFIRRKRLVAPLLRSAEGQREAGFEEVYARIALAMKAAAKEHGPGAVGVFVSPELTSEELLLAGLIAREGLGSGNVGSLSLAASCPGQGPGDSPPDRAAAGAGRSAIEGADLLVCSNASLETDHLVLGVDVMDAVRRGATLVAVNSALDQGEKALAALTLDPLRGTASLFWEGILQALLEGGLPSGKVEDLPGWEEYRKGPAFDPAATAARTGVGEADVRQVAALLRASRRTVFITCPDRGQDRSEGDIQAFANLVLFLRAAGSEAELVLPRAQANAAGTHAAGADPAFAAGGLPAPALPGAASLAQLRRILDDGALKAALVLGEDPLRHDRYAAWFRGVEFLGVSDWTETETTRSADAVLPAASFLETAGSRLSFDGTSRDFARCVAPPSGKSGWEILSGLAAAFGIDPGSVSGAGRLLAQAAGLSPGPKGVAPAAPRLARPAFSGKAEAVLPPMTQMEAYKRGARQEGAERYRNP